MFDHVSKHLELSFSVFGNMMKHSCECLIYYLQHRVQQSSNIAHHPISQKSISGKVIHGNLMPKRPGCLDNQMAGHTIEPQSLGYVVLDLKHSLDITGNKVPKLSLQSVNFPNNINTRNYCKIKRHRLKIQLGGYG